MRERGRRWQKNGGGKKDGRVPTEHTEYAEGGAGNVERAVARVAGSSVRAGVEAGGTSRARVRVWAAPAVGAPRGRAAAARVGALLATSWQVLTRLRLPVAGLRSSAPDARAGGTWYRACAPAPRSCTTWLRAGDTQPAIVRYTVCNRALQRGGRALPGCGRTPHGRGRPPPGCGRARPLCRLSVTVRRRLKTWFLAVFQCVKVS